MKVNEFFTVIGRLLEDPEHKVIKPPELLILTDMGIKDIARQTKFLSTMDETTTTEVGKKNYTIPNNDRIISITDIWHDGKRLEPVDRIYIDNLQARYFVDEEDLEGEQDGPGVWYWDRGSSEINLWPLPTSAKVLRFLQSLFPVDITKPADYEKDLTTDILLPKYCYTALEKYVVMRGNSYIETKYKSSTNLTQAQLRHALSNKAGREYQQEIQKIRNTLNELQEKKFIMKETTGYPNEEAEY